MDASDDPYKILGVTKDATATEIKKAYRTLALKNHPDKQTNDIEREKASAIFSKIAAAYEILSDDEERRQYDLRIKHGGAPGTRYTTTDNTATNSPDRRTTTSRVYTSPNSTNSSKQRSMSAPETGTFKFSYDPSKVESSNPYDIFKEVFGSDFENSFPGAELSKSKAHRNKSTPISIPRTNTIARTQPNPTPKVIQKVSAVNSDDVVSMSKSTRTICHPDGTQEVITETKITTADGCTRTTSESSRVSTSSPQKSGKQIKSLGRPYLTMTSTRN
jgi:curved DNA-binding protein CbpA